MARDTRKWPSRAFAGARLAPARRTTSPCEMDLCPGGMFRTVMRSPIENEKMVMTNALEPAYGPASVGKGGEMVDCADMPFTSILTLKERGGKTLLDCRAP